MTDFDSLLGTVYEAGAMPERWPDVLERLARYVGATGGNIIVSAPQRAVIIPSPSTAEVTREFDAQGWNTQNTRVSRLIARADHPGFLTDADLHTAEELRTLPMYKEFLTPRGADAGAATVISGADDDAILVTLEAFDDHDAARQAVPLLDRLRPHLARVARGIAFGRTATELALDLGVSHETVRSHLKKVFAKTSTRRQSELALLMARFK